MITDHRFLCVQKFASTVSDAEVTDLNSRKLKVLFHYFRYLTLILYVALSDDLSAALTLPFLRRFIVELARHFKRRSLSLQFLAHFAHKQTR